MTLEDITKQVTSRHPLTDRSALASQRPRIDTPKTILRAVPYHTANKTRAHAVWRSMSKGLESVLLERYLNGQSYLS